MNPQRQDKTKNARTKQDFTLMPWGAIKRIEPVMAYGAGKYEPLGYYSVPDRRNQYIKATMRHLVDFFIGVARGIDEPLDDETGLPHLCHAGASLLIALDDSCDVLPETRAPAPPTARSQRDPKSPSKPAPIVVGVESPIEPISGEGYP